MLKISGPTNWRQRLFIFRRRLFSKHTLRLLIKGFVWYLLVILIARGLGIEITGNLLILLIISGFISDVLHTDRRVEECRDALNEYHQALSNREHGGVAAARLISKIQLAFGKFWP